jgi:hypothetical protein
LRGQVEPTPGERYGMDVPLGWVAGSGGSARDGIRAYHGSPHQFDRFDMSRIGTGEGAQAYGHGLYFAGNEGVAKAYRDALSGVPPQFADLNFGGRASQIRARRALEDAIKSGLKGDDALDSAMQALSKEGDLASSSFVRQANYDAVNALAPLRGKPLEINPGAIYEVNLNTTPDRLLDWDAPLIAQPIEARNIATTLDRLGKLPANPTGRDVWQGMRSPQPAREMGYRNWSTAGPAEYLRDTGIDGIQYLDAGSRAAGDGTRNYVMFDDKLIDILRRYGLAGMLAGGAASQAQAGEP